MNDCGSKVLTEQCDCVLSSGLILPAGLAPESSHLPLRGSPPVRLYVFSPGFLLRSHTSISYVPFARCLSRRSGKDGALLCVQMRIHTTIAATANTPTAAPRPIPAFVPSVMFDMMVVKPMQKSRPSQGRWEIKLRIDVDDLILDNLPGPL